MRKFLVLILLAGMAFAGWKYRAHLPQLMTHVAKMIGRSGDLGDPARAKSPKPDPARYQVMREDLQSWREKLAAAHRKAKTPEARKAAEHDARVVLEAVLPEMMRCWLGTPWDFHGTAEGPGEDPIACGYFVSTVLQDAGFRLDRYRLAKQPSSRILTTFVPRDDCQLMVDVPYETFTRDLTAMEPGIYLVGLDTHVAFLVVDREGFRFVHSSGANPHCVVDESARDADVLRNSRWRMMANLTADQDALRKWLSGQSFAVREL